MGERHGRDPEGPADLLITGAAVCTMDPAREWAEAVAVRDGAIAAVGTEDGLRDLVGPRTEVLSLPGRMILPGFQDAHVHPPFGGRFRLTCELHDVYGREEYRATIAAYARAHPDEEWIYGGGWAMDAFPGGTPRREDLDDIVPDRPIFLMNTDVHSAWVNGKALEMAGITRQTPDPPDGRIERDPGGGEPTGTLHEGAAKLVERLIPAPTQADWQAAIESAQSYLHSLGIVAWQDAWVTPDMLRAYRALEEDGKLTARVVAALWWERERGEEQVEEFVEQREWGTSGRLRATSVKMMLDGVPENFTAAMFEPYFDLDGCRTDNTGISFIDAEALRHYVTRLDAEGFQVHFHAIGDRAIRNALDAVEAAREANGARDARHHIAHLQVVHPDDVPRFARLGVVANFQPLWACDEPQMRELTIPFLGPERAAQQYPIGSLLRTGAKLAFGSDWSVSSPDPLLETEVAITRVDPENRDNEPFLPEQRLDLATALRAFTLGSAAVNHLEEETGSLAAGKQADLVVLDRNLFAPDTGPVGDAQVEMTMVGGEVVYEAAEA